MRFNEMEQETELPLNKQLSCLGPMEAYGRSAWRIF